MKKKPSKSHFGQPQNKYSKEPGLCEKIKSQYFSLKQDEWVDNKKIHNMLNEEFGVPLSTLYRWTNKWEINPKWSPADTSVHGNFHRIFNDDEEKNMVEYIDSNYINPGNYFSGIHFQSLAFEAFDEKFGEEEDMPHFNCSPQFIQDFKERNKITSRVAHFRQRPVKKTDEEITNELNEFKIQIQSLIESAQNSDEPILNCDETGFSILPTTIKTWAFKKAKNIVVNVNDDLKNRISVMATISSDNQKLPLFIIAKADNEDDAMDQLGELINDNQFTFSNSSYMNSDCFIKYLYFLRSLYPKIKQFTLF